MNWDVCSISSLSAEPTRNGIYKSSEFHGTGAKIINMKEMFTFDFISNQEMNRVELNDREKSVSTVVDGDLLFARRSVVPEGSGKCSIVISPQEMTTYESSIIRVRLSKNIANPLFYYYLFKSPYGRALVLSISTGAAVKGIKGSDLRLLQVPYPKLDVQEKIASILFVYDNLIENNLKRIKLLEEAAQLLYRQWFVNFKFPGHEKTKFIKGIPEGWETKTMEDVCQSVGGGTPSTKIPQYWDNGTITWVIPTDITQNDSLILLDSEKKITPEGLQHSSTKMLPPDTILMTSRASVGFFGLIDKEVCTNQGFISVIPNEDYMRMYLLFNLICRKDEIVSKAGGATYKEINKSTFRALKILVPGGVILKQFNSLAYEYLRQARIIKKQNNCLKEARDILLPRLMDGSIEV